MKKLEWLLRLLHVLLDKLKDSFTQNTNPSQTKDYAALFSIVRADLKEHITQLLILTPLHLAVNNSPVIRSSPYQSKSAKVKQISASVVCRGPHRVVAIPVPLVNNRKGSLLPLSKPSTLKLSLVGSRDLAQVGQPPRLAEENRRLQRARSLPVKYRYHPGHPSVTTLSQRQRKSQLPHLPPTLAVLDRPVFNNNTTKACACQAGVAACEAFFTNDPASAAVSCETLNIEQAEQRCEGPRELEHPSPLAAPCTSTSSIMVSVLDMSSSAEECDL